MGSACLFYGVCPRVCERVHVRARECVCLSYFGLMVILVWRANVFASHIGLMLILFVVSGPGQLER